MTNPKQINQMMRQVQKMQADMAAAQEALANEVVQQVLHRQLPPAERAASGRREGHAAGADCPVEQSSRPPGRQ